MSSPAPQFENGMIERYALGCILLDPSRLKNVTGYDPRVFDSPRNREIFKQLLRMYHSSIPIDMVSVVRECTSLEILDDVGGAAYIARLTDDIPSVANFRYYFNSVVEDSKKRAVARAAEAYKHDPQALTKQLQKINRQHKKMARESEELAIDDEDEEELDADLEGDVDPALFHYNQPLALAAKMRSTARDDRETWHRFFYYNPDLVSQACAALYFSTAYDDPDQPRLKKSGNTVWQYQGHPGYYWRPTVDLTKPKLPFNPLPFLSGEEEFCKLFGQDFYTVDKNGKTLVKHHARGMEGKIAVHFFTYCNIFLPPAKRFFMQSPRPTVSCLNGLFDLEKRTLEPHSPNHGQFVPAFPYNYAERDAMNEEHKTTIAIYLTNFAPAGQEVEFARYLGFRIGYTLTPWRMKKFFIDIGPGDTGKTGFLENIGRLHREPNTIKHADLFRMAQKPGDFDNAVFEESLVVLNDDFPPAAKLPAQVLKTIANKNTVIQINQKHKPSYSRVNTSTIMLSTNSDPKSPDSYISNRLVCTPFENVFEPCEENDELMKKMDNPEIEETLFNYGVHCMADFFLARDIDSVLPKCVVAKTNKVIEELNDTIEWIREAVASGQLIEGEGLRIKKGDLYGLYFKARGTRAGGRNVFYMEAKKMYTESKSMGYDYFEGVGIGIDDGGDIPYSDQRGGW